MDWALLLYCMPAGNGTKSSDLLEPKVVEWAQKAMNDLVRHIVTVKREPIAQLGGYLRPCLPVWPVRMAVGLSAGASSIFSYELYLAQCLEV